MAGHEPKGSSFRGLQLLVVEDSFVSARSLVTMLLDLGVEVIGPAPNVREAIALLGNARCDGAILDIDLGSETSEVIAERLHRLGTPFLFVSGFSAPQGLIKNEVLRGRRVIPKPIEPGVLRHALAETFDSATRPG